MTQALNVICAALRAMAPKPRAVPTPYWVPTAPATIPSIPTSRSPRIAKDTMKRLYQPSPLANDKPMPTVVIDMIEAAYRDPAVARAAIMLNDQRSRLARIVEFEGVVAEAMNEILAGTDAPGDMDYATMVAKVTGVLKRLGDEAASEVELVRADQAHHKARYRARMMRLQPLRIAVSTKSEAIHAEINGLCRREAALRTGCVNPGVNRYQGLLASGFRHEEIASLNLQPPTDPVQDAQALQDRMAALRIQLLPLTAFLADPLFSTEHLAGLDEFAPLVEARIAADEVLA